jgi:hypothetical protein
MVHVDELGEQLNRLTSRTDSRPTPREHRPSAQVSPDLLGTGRQGPSNYELHE